MERAATDAPLATPTRNHELVNAEQGCRVTVRFTVYDDANNLVDSGEPPVEFTIGRNEVIAGIERVVVGRRPVSCHKTFVQMSASRQALAPSDSPGASERFGIGDCEPALCAFCAFCAATSSRSLCFLITFDECTPRTSIA